MTPAVDAALHQQIGALAAKMDLVLQDQQAARTSRKEQYEKTEEIQRKLDSVEGSVETLAERIGKIEPVTTDIGRWKERFIGMRILIVFIAALGGASFATFAKWIAIKLGWV